MVGISTTGPRPMEGLYLRDCLKRLAQINAIASSLQYYLDNPLTEDDIAAGAEPFTTEQFKSDLEEIAMIATSLALDEMQATTEEWYAANDKIE